ncbi:uncharacterized protein LOC34619658 [Cyclospora cayetanensis]|uniref:Uncharacterized protein LOC34619658 n=1 Tax=Cyclospora cayetanensis TaxID=88456 RepID=A0A6P6RQM1_9EIME|nr:uncharacterized protein LOC34619658 [Cyclospora cayetanensis]
MCSQRDDSELYECHNKHNGSATGEEGVSKVKLSATADPCAQRQQRKMKTIPAEPKELENQKTCLDIIRDSFAARPISVRILIVLTLDQSNPNFETVEEGLQLRADESPKEAITGIGMFVAHFAVLLLEGAYRPVMDCVRWLDQLEATRQILDGTVIFFSDYRTYKLMPSYWSFRPKDFLDMRFDEGDIELTEEAVAQQATSLYEKMVLLIHELRSTNLEARLDPTGLLAKEFVKFAPDPRVVHALLSASITKNLLFSLGGKEELACCVEAVLLVLFSSELPKVLLYSYTSD